MEKTIDHEIVQHSFSVIVFVNAIMFFKFNFGMHLLTSSFLNHTRLAILYFDYTVKSVLFV